MDPWTTPGPPRHQGVGRRPSPSSSMVSTDTPPSLDTLLMGPITPTRGAGRGAAWPTCAAAHPSPGCQTSPVPPRSTVSTTTPASFDTPLMPPNAQTRGPGRDAALPTRAATAASPSWTPPTGMHLPLNDLQPPLTLFPPSLLHRDTRDHARTATSSGGEAPPSPPASR